MVPAIIEINGFLSSHHSCKPVNVRGRGRRKKEEVGLLVTIRSGVLLISVELGAGQIECFGVETAEQLNNL